MKKIYTLALSAMAACCMSAAEITDVISAGTITIAETYTEQEVTLTSPAVYLVTLKDDGNGPQFKAGSSGIVTKESAGTVKRVEVAWGSKSNEDIEVYGQHTPYASSSGVIGGMLLGTIEFSAGATTGIDIDGDWEYIGITTTAKKGKAAQFGSLSVVWQTSDATEHEPCEGVLISEVCGDDGTADGHEDWIELFNPTATALDLSGVAVQKTDEDGVPAIIATLAEGTTLMPGEFLVVEKGTHFTSGISNNKNLNIALLSPMGVKIDMFDKASNFTHNGSHPTGGSYSRTDNSGAWYITNVASKGSPNLPCVEPVPAEATYRPVTADDLKDGIEVIMVNTANGYAMSYNWDTTKDGSVYLNAVNTLTINADGTLSADASLAKIAVVTLIDGNDGTWALKFGATNNYLNDSRYMACKKFKNIDFKKNDDPTKGTRASITFNTEGDAEISFGAEAGALKFNYKDDGTSRFLNYDPTDKPEDHLAVTLFTLSDASGMTALSVETGVEEYYNLQGMKIANPVHGQIVIVKTGSKTVKKIF